MNPRNFMGRRPGGAYAAPVPALRALAHGADVDLAPRQERYLPHEAAHVLQQRQGRVAPAGNLLADVPINAGDVER